MGKNESIFPEIEKTLGNCGETYFEVLRGGLTKREIFAAMAMQGFCTNTHAYEELDMVAQVNESVKYADALIKALGK